MRWRRCERHASRRRDPCLLPPVTPSEARGLSCGLKVPRSARDDSGALSELDSRRTDASATRVADGIHAGRRRLACCHPEQSEGPLRQQGKNLDAPGAVCPGPTQGVPRFSGLPGFRRFEQAGIAAAGALADVHGRYITILVIQINNYTDVLEDFFAPEPAKESQSTVQRHSQLPDTGLGVTARGVTPALGDSRASLSSDGLSLRSRAWGARRLAGWATHTPLPTLRNRRSEPSSGW